jgi:propanol-preferring alcohol dehydrogenase
MRAALLWALGEPFTVEDVPRPEPGPGQVRIRIGGAGVCHSDLHFLSGATTRPGMPPAPWILGHENAGWVDAVGAGVTGLEVGRPVAVSGGWGCGQCRVCLRGEEQLCNSSLWGGMGIPGGYAEHLIVPAARHVVPIDGLDPVDVAPLTDAGLTPYRAVKKALPRLVPGTTAVVIGAGGLGQFGVQMLAALSPARVVALDLAEPKRVLASALGAELVLDPASPGVVEEIQSFAGPEGPAAVLDFVGVEATLALALQAVGRRGLVVIVGLGGGAVPLSFRALAAEASVTTSYWGSRSDLEEVVALAQRGAISARVERHDLTQINQVLSRLAAGEIEGRAVLVP